METGSLNCLDMVHRLSTKIHPQKHLNAAICRYWKRLKNRLGLKKTESIFTSNQHFNTFNLTTLWCDACFYHIHKNKCFAVSPAPLLHVLSMHVGTYTWWEGDQNYWSQEVWLVHCSTALLTLEKIPPEMEVALRYINADYTVDIIRTDYTIQTARTA